MDLDEMKAGWNTLNELLARNEILNRRMIKEMITARTQSAYDIIYRCEWQQLLLTLFIGIILFVGYNLSDLPLKCSSFIFLEIIMFIALLIGAFMIYTLSKFNLGRMKVNELTHIVLTYKKYYWYNKKYGSLIGLGGIVIFLFLENTHTNFHVLLTIFIMLIIGGVYSFTKIRKHAQKIKEVEQGLEELAEFESSI